MHYRIKKQALFSTTNPFFSFQQYTELFHGTKKYATAYLHFFVFNYATPIARLHNLTEMDYNIGLSLANSFYAAKEMSFCLKTTLDS